MLVAGGGWCQYLLRQVAMAVDWWESRGPMPIARVPKPRTLLRAVERPAAAAPSISRPADEQLERILRSGTFHQSDRLKRFLTFIVSETAACRANTGAGGVFSIVILLEPFYGNRRRCSRPPSRGSSSQAT